MFGSQVLEVMIGLLLIYLAFSVACSGIKEIIASLFALRAKTLETGIRNMLHDSTGDLTAKVMDHPVISGTAPPGQRPSYVSSRNFATALVDVVVTGNAPRLTNPSDAGQLAALAGSMYGSSPTLGMFLQDLDAVTKTSQTPTRTIGDLRAGVANVSSPNLRRTLQGFVDSAGGNLAVAESKIQTWFDDTMERVSGWYKREAQKLIFGAAVVSCALLNADTFQIAKSLWGDEALRNAVVAQATKRVQQGIPVPAKDGSAVNLPALRLPDLQEVGKEAGEAHPLPLGWRCPTEGCRAAIQKIPTLWLTGLLKFFGILITSFAILLGAPFWFDLLNKVINLRISGEPPA